jgi:hypothetical protein
VRADEVYSSKPVMGDIWEYIQKAEIVIADLTERNPNVLYELGLCHALWKRIILLAQRIEEVPFDLQQFRVIIYEQSLSGAEKLAQALYRAVSLIRDETAEEGLGIEITFPVDGQSIYGDFTAKGKFKNRPRVKDVRTFVASIRDKRIWPQGSVVFDDKNKTWSCAINIWEHPKPEAYVFIAGLGEDATVLCDYYGVVGSIAQWIPLRELTSDAVEYDRVRVLNGFQQNGGA